MKTLLRVYVIHLLGIWLLTYIFTGSFLISGGLVSFLIASLILTLLNLLLKPILKLLFFPVNVLTLGLFSLIINALVFYVFIRLSSSVSITEWTFPGISLNGFSISPVKLNFMGSLFVESLSLSLITNTLMFFLK